MNKIVRFGMVDVKVLCTKGVFIGMTCRWYKFEIWVVCSEWSRVWICMKIKISFDDKGSKEKFQVIQKANEHSSIQVF